MLRLSACLAGCLLTAALTTEAAFASVNYGDISHKGYKQLGPASTSTKLYLELGLNANNSGISNAAKSASNPTSSSYGKYLTLSKLQSTYGASSNTRNGVVNGFKKYGVTAKVDVTHLRVTATISIGNAQKLFGTKWDVYNTGSQKVALPVDTPKLGSGLSGNVNTIAGMGAVLSGSAADLPSVVASPAPSPDTVQRATAAASDGGTPYRTGTISPGCATSTYPSAVHSSAGLFPNQILTAYGISLLQAGGLHGHNVRVAILGEAPTPTNDVSAYRSCFGFGGTGITIHNGSGITPILESSLDVMTVAMVAPKLAHFDLWVKQLGHNNPQAVLGLLADPLQATTNGASLPNVISISYGICEASISKYGAVRTLVNRQLAATAALGITTVVAAGDSGSSACAHGVKPSQLTSFDEQKSASWPATSPWVLAAGGTNLTLTPANAIASSGVWNDTLYPAPYNMIAAGGGGASTYWDRPSWQPATSSQSTYRMIPDVAAFADAAPGYVVVCSSAVSGCPHTSGQTIAYVGGTSAAAPLVAGMIALWDQYAAQEGWPKPGFVAPLLYYIAKHDPVAFRDITTGTNSVFSNVSCCQAGTGFDMASGLGSPYANLIAAYLHH